MCGCGGSSSAFSPDRFLQLAIPDGPRVTIKAKIFVLGGSGPGVAAPGPCPAAIHAVQVDASPGCLLYFTFGKAVSGAF